MLTITVPMEEGFDDEKQQFVVYEGFELELEHSLVSLSKWESKHKKPFLTADEKTAEELFDYVLCMILTPDVPDEVMRRLSKENFKEINDYINDEKTATWINDAQPQRPSREAVTSELIYFWMFSYQIDKECETWHLSRLITLIKVFNRKNSAQNQPRKSKAQIAQERRELNARRRAMAGTTG